MWAAIAIIVIALLLVLAAPKPKIENARAANLGDFQFPRSKEGDPVPWFLGTVRLKSPNSLWYGDYTPVPIKKKQKTGLFSSKRVTVGYKYHVGLDLCWCLAGDDTVELLRLWSDKHTFFQGSLTTQSSITVNLPNLFGGEEQRGGLIGTIDFYPGRFNEERNAYLVQKASPDVPAYVGQCRTVFRGSVSTQASGFYFGTTTSVNAISAEMRRLSRKVHATYSVMPNGFDVNPMEFMYAAFTEKFGMPGVSTDDIDLPSWQTCAEQLYNEGLGMSLLVQQGVTGKDLAEEALRIADGILYQDDESGKIIARLIREDYVVEDLPVFDESVVKELVSFNKTTWEQTYNQCRVTFKDRANEYADKAATAQDFANINFQQRVKNTDISVPGCFVNDEANQLAVRQLSLLSVPLFQIEIRCNRKASLMKPGDLFVFEYAPYGITNMVMRVQRIDKGLLTDGVVTINAVQDRFAVALATFAPPTDSGWVNPVGDALPLAREGLFELPYELSESDTAVVATLGSSGQTVDLGYAVWRGDTTGVLAEKDLVSDLTPSAVTTDAYPADTDARDSTGFEVSGVLHDYEILTSVTEDELLAGDSVLLIRSSAGDELVAAKEFDGDQVSDVIRGIYGTVPLSHPSGARVFFLSGGYGIANEDEPYTTFPRDVFAKLQTYNQLGRVDLADVDELELEVVGKSSRPAVPGKVRVNGADQYGLGTVTGIFNLTWAHRNRTNPTVVTQDDDSVTPEASTRYNVRAYNASNVLLAEANNANAVLAQCRFNYTGMLRIELEAVADGVTSYAKHSFTFNYNQGSETVSEIVPDETSVIFDGGRV